MEAFTVFCALAIFVGSIIFLSRRIKDYAVEDPSLVSKVLIAANCVICVLSCVYLTTRIDINETQTPIAPKDTSGFGTLAYLMFLWYFFSIFIGSMLAGLSMVAAMIASSIKNGEKALDRFSHIPGCESGVWIGVYTGFVISAYIVVMLSIQNYSARVVNAPFIGN